MCVLIYIHKLTVEGNSYNEVTPFCYRVGVRQITEHSAWFWSKIF